MHRKNFQNRKIDRTQKPMGKALLWDRIENEMNKKSIWTQLTQMPRLVSIGFTAALLIGFSLATYQFQKEIPKNIANADFELIKHLEDSYENPSFQINTPEFYSTTPEEFAKSIYFEPAIPFKVKQFHAHEYHIIFLEEVNLNQNYRVYIEYKKEDGTVETRAFEWNPSP